MKATLPRATSACGDKIGGDGQGIFMVWSVDDSRVAAVYGQETHDQDEALSGWKTVVQQP